MFDSYKGGSGPRSFSLGNHQPPRSGALSLARRACQVVVIVALSAGSVVALAQEAPAPTATDQTPLQEVVVTGTHIKQPGLVATSPTQVVTAEDIKVGGKIDISEVLEELPQNFDDNLGQDFSNRTSGLTTAGGVATADLRGLGPNRTLVLVDGIRLGIGSPNTFINSPAPDLDQIPAFLIDRVDVVTGGASAVYGSDAIAGVVNFIMKKDFQGIQVDGQVGVDQHDNNNSTITPLLQSFGAPDPQGSRLDGQSRQFDVVMGSNFADGQGNVTAYFGFYDQSPVAGSQRDWDACQTAEVKDASGAVVGRTCTGSSNSNFVDPITGPNANTVFSVYGSSFVPRGSVATYPPAAFNSQPYIYATRGDTRYSAGFIAHDDLNSYIRPYAQFYYTDDRTHTSIAPDAVFVGENEFDPLGGGYYYTNCSNPLLSAQERGILCTPAQVAADTAAPGSVAVPLDLRRRNVEGGARNSYFDHASYRAVVGVKGDFADAWSYDAYAQYYYVDMFESNTGYYNLQSLNNALLVTGTAANPVCISGGSCIPYNIWTTGGVTTAQLNSLYLTGTSEGNYTMRTLHAEVSGDLTHYGLKLPTADQGLGVAFGLEHRGEQQVYAPDSAEESGLQLGAGAAAVALDVSDHVMEEFAELRVPLVQGLPWVKDLNFDTGIRRSDYSISGKVEAHKFELQYAPNDDVRFRASFEKAIRAPSLIELFNPQNPGINTIGSDPCAPDASTGVAQATLAQCLNTVPASERAAFTAAYGNGGSTNIIPQTVDDQGYLVEGGNPTLKPEIGKTWTVGASFTPTFVPGLTGSIDYFHILLTNEIGVASAEGSLSGCLAQGDAADCSQVVRNYATFSFNGPTLATGGYILDVNQNIGAALFSGIDIALNYRLDLPAGLGAFTVALNGTYTKHDGSGIQTVGPTSDCAGDYGPICAAIIPVWKHTMRLSWVTPFDVTPSLTWRYIGKVESDNNDPNLGDGAYPVYGAPLYVNSTIPAYNYLDFAVTYNPIKNLELRGGINNFLDKDPPLAFGDAAGGYNTYSIYDLVGRQVFLSFTAKF